MFSELLIPTGGQHTRPIAMEVFRAENPTYAGDICMKPLSGGTTGANTGDSTDCQFRNPLYDSAEVEERYYAKPGVQESPPFPDTPPLAAYYSTVANSPLVEPHPYNSAKGSKIPAKRHQYDSVDIEASPPREVERTMPCDHAERFEGEKQMDQLEVSPPVQVAPTYHYDSVEGGREYDSL